jgi:hypothetical protein
MYGKLGGKKDRGGELEYFNNNLQRLIHDRQYVWQMQLCEQSFEVSQPTLTYGAPIPTKKLSFNRMGEFVFCHSKQ